MGEKQPSLYLYAPRWCHYHARMRPQSASGVGGMSRDGEGGADLDRVAVRPDPRGLSLDAGVSCQYRLGLLGDQIFGVHRVGVRPERLAVGPVVDHDPELDGVADVVHSRIVAGVEYGRPHHVPRGRPRWQAGRVPFGALERPGFSPVGRCEEEAERQHHGCTGPTNCGPWRGHERAGEWVWAWFSGGPHATLSSRERRGPRGVQSSGDYRSATREVGDSEWWCWRIGMGYRVTVLRWAQRSPQGWWEDAWNRLVRAVVVLAAVCVWHAEVEPKNWMVCNF